MRNLTLVSEFGLDVHPSWGQLVGKLILENTRDNHKAPGSR